MVDVEELKAQAAEVDAVVTCDCGFEEAFDAFLMREQRVDEEAGTIIFGCPECGSDSLHLGQRRPEHQSPVIIAEDLAELENITMQGGRDE